MKNTTHLYKIFLKEYCQNLIVILVIYYAHLKKIQSNLSTTNKIIVEIYNVKWEVTENTRKWITKDVPPICVLLCRKICTQPFRQELLRQSYLYPFSDTFRVVCSLFTFISLSMSSNINFAESGYNKGTTQFAQLTSKSSLRNPMQFIFVNLHILTCTLCTPSR